MCSLVPLLYLENPRSRPQFPNRTSGEAEYRAVVTTICELVWITALLHDLQIHLSNHASLYSDSKTAIHIASNPIFHERTKHIWIDYHFVCDKIQISCIRTFHVSSKSQLIVLPSPLAILCFFDMLSKLSLLNIHAPA